MARKEPRSVLSLIYFHNPFYLISACLFVYGLKLLFRSGNTAVLFDRGSVAYMEPWGLMASLAGVTVLMGVTAILIVRFGKVWEDARSLVLIVLLMLLAISVSLDELIMVLSDPDNSRRHLFLAFGLGSSFAIGTSEILLRGLKVRLLWAYRLPLYGFLLLFFLWPATLLTEVTAFTESQTRWMIALFPVVAAVLTLSLIPAVRKGAAAVANNGTPWSWPLFPWSPFVFIALAVCFRSYSLTMSFDVVSARGHYWNTMFGVYLLVPFLMAVLVVLLEIGIVEKRRGLQRGVMLTAPLLLLLAYPWLVPWSQLTAYTSFAYSVVNQIASPVFLTILGLAALYAWAWYKGVRHAEAGFTGMLLLSSYIGPGAFGHRIWSLADTEPTLWPILVLLAVQILLGIRKRNSFRIFAALIIAGICVRIPAAELEAIGPWRGFLVIHLLTLVIIVIGRIYTDLFAEFCKDAGPLALFLTTVTGFSWMYQISPGVIWLMTYGVGMVLLAFGLAKLLTDQGYKYVAWFECCLAVGLGVILGIYAFSQASFASGVKQIILAAVSFVAAVFISILKGGLSRRIRLYMLQRRRAAG